MSFSLKVLLFSRLLIIFVDRFSLGWIQDKGWFSLAHKHKHKHKHKHSHKQMRKSTMFVLLVLMLMLMLCLCSSCGKLVSRYFVNTAAGYALMLMFWCSHLLLNCAYACAYALVKTSLKGTALFIGVFDTFNILFNVFLEKCKGRLIPGTKPEEFERRKAINWDCASQFMFLVCLLVKICLQEGYVRLVTS